MYIATHLIADKLDLSTMGTDDILIVRESMSTCRVYLKLKPIAPQDSIKCNTVEHCISLVDAEITRRAIHHASTSGEWREALWYSTQLMSMSHELVRRNMHRDVATLYARWLRTKVRHVESMSTWNGLLKDASDIQLSQVHQDPCYMSSELLLRCLYTQDLQKVVTCEIDRSVTNAMADMQKLNTFIIPAIQYIQKNSVDRVQASGCVVEGFMLGSQDARKTTAMLNTYSKSTPLQRHPSDAPPATSRLPEDQRQSMHHPVDVNPGSRQLQMQVY